MSRTLLIITLLLFSLDLEARGGGGGRRVGGGGDFHPAGAAAHPAMNRDLNRAGVRPLQRTPALSRAALNAATWGAGVGAAEGGGGDYVNDSNQPPIEIQIPSLTNPSSNTNSNQ